MSKDSGGGFFTGLMIGAVIGLAVGFLYAPQPGNETRRIVKEKMSTARENASSAASRLKEKAKQQAEKLEEDVSIAKENATQAASRLKERAQKTMEDLGENE